MDQRPSLSAAEIPRLYYELAQLGANAEGHWRRWRHGKLAPELSTTMMNVTDYYAKMKPELFKDLRMKKTADYGKFQRDIERSIDSGIPLLWSVQLGLVPEKGIPQGTFGGHMRLIIGYDDATREILYSDSWGLGHEEKRMPMDDAWTITTGLFTLQPVGT